MFKKLKNIVLGILVELEFALLVISIGFLLAVFFTFHKI